MAAITKLRTRILEALSKAGIESSEAQREADLILEHATGLSKAQQMAYPETVVDEPAAKEIERILAGRAEREPLQYLLGHQWFMGLKFAVEPGVLIPRADTETLVTCAFDYLKDLESPLFVDVGAGSGAVVISLLKLLPRATALAIDISEKALAVTAANADDLGVANRMRVLAAPLQSFHPDAAVDAVISNPPYIPAADLEHLQPEVRKYEPREALVGAGQDGLGFYRDLLMQVPRYLRAGGMLAVEIGAGQAEQVKSLFVAGPWQNICIHADLNGIARCISAVHAGKAIVN